MSYSEARYERVPVPEEPPERRVQSFDEVLHSYTKDEAIMEASRCLQCALPFCVEACPIAQDARGYIGLIAGGQFDQAADTILRENPLATTLCKVCYHYCEDACIMGHRGIADRDPAPQARRPRARRLPADVRHRARPATSASP